MNTHILIVDDDSRLTSALRRTLAYEGYQVSVAANGEGALSMVRTRPPDLVILDLMLPGIDGLEVCRRLRSAGDGTAVLMLTARDAVVDRVTGLETGADDYLVKPFALEELLARVKALLRRRNPPDITREVLVFEDLELDTATRQAKRGNRLIDLSTTEYELLAMFLRNPRMVLTRSVLATSSVLLNREEVQGYVFSVAASSHTFLRCPAGTCALALWEYCLYTGRAACLHRPRYYPQ